MKLYFHRGSAFDFHSITLGFSRENTTPRDFNTRLSEPNTRCINCRSVHKSVSLSINVCIATEALLTLNCSSFLFLAWSYIDFLFVARFFVISFQPRRWKQTRHHGLFICFIRPTNSRDLRNIENSGRREYLTGWNNASRGLWWCM